MTALSRPQPVQGQPEALDRVELVGVHVHRVTMDCALGVIDRFIRDGGPHHVVTLDASMCVMARKDSNLRELIRNAELVTPDSAGVLWASRRTGQPLTERVSGVEIVERLCALSPIRGYKLFFLGAAPGIAETAARRMMETYPGCRIVGFHDGFFLPEQERELLESIRAAKPDVLCVAMGIPKQEKWIGRHRDSLGVPVLIGVGGTLDVLSGSVPRAPRWIQKLNMEWLYRFLKNPRKIGKLLTLPRFVWLVMTRRR